MSGACFPACEGPQKQLKNAGWKACEGPQKQLKNAGWKACEGPQKQLKNAGWKACEGPQKQLKNAGWKACATHSARGNASFRKTLESAHRAPGIAHQELPDRAAAGLACAAGPHSSTMTLTFGSGA